MPDRERENILIVFVKYPEPGKVKTRIARELGAERAAHIYSQMAKRIIGKVWRPDAYRAVIFFDPQYREMDVRSWLGIDNVSYAPQSTGTIGDKMSNAFERVFSEGAGKAVLIGTDVPEITADIVITACGMLNDTDVVLGPSYDGGYYLIGLRRFEPALFRDIDWGTATVFDRTLNRIIEKNLSHKSLDTLKDVDTAGDIDPGMLTRLSAED